MLCSRVVTLLCLLGVVSVQATDFFDFTHTLRLDVYHTGTAQAEAYSIDQIYLQDDWPGSRVNLIDTLNLGIYQMRVYKQDTDSLMYSYGYCCVFQEWQTTRLAAEQRGAFHETLRFPCPVSPVDVVIVRRQGGVFSDTVFTAGIDPDSRFVNREGNRYDFKVRKIQKNGKPEHKVDLVIVGDGYTRKELSLFHEHVDRYTRALFETQPFSDHKNDFNVWAVDVISRDSGIDEPRKDKWKRTPIGAGYNSLDLPRYVLAHNNKALHDIAALVPYDHIYVLVHSDRYGGGGIFHSMAVSYTGHCDNQPEWWSEYVFVHEFGHSFAGLADEYYSSRVAYENFYTPGVEPWEPNITALLNRKQPKWGHLIEKDVRVPTPWRKSEFDRLMRLSRENRWMSEGQTYLDQASDLLAAEYRQALVGCYEGAGYVSKGLYRSFIDCRMFSKSLVPFCPVCQQAIARKIRFEIK
ncbi:MAG: M64 family metallopeptidase [candidate division KSB1 bacterium]|nr:M64 family metallopeptidase [candidate division KSB1 bacterium]